ncbi:MAG: PQQ-dependent sugar dehydrogenase [Lentimicrobium sp.]|nr:PQQ-dependent sugar dehydrogenase [Lentimicrobium sp.]
MTHRSKLPIIRLPLSVMILLLLIFIAGCSKSSNSQVNIGSTSIDTLTILQNIATPWELSWGPDDQLWFTEREGRVNHTNPEDGNNTVILTIPEVYQKGESGLLGMALHPEFTTTPFVYLVYTYLDGPMIREKLVRYTWNGTSLNQPEVLLTDIPANSYHDGSRLAFGPDGKLYMSTGDAGHPPNSQNLNVLAGKILRLNDDGSIPADNPNPESYVWAFGLRNSQGLVFAPDGTLYGSEHGPSSDDEVNILEMNRNYGWPDVVGFCDTPQEQAFCAQHNVREPLYAWTPTLAVAGIDHYHHNAIPEWQNSLIMTSLKASTLYSLKLNESGTAITEVTAYFNDTWGRLRDVCISPSGDVYLAVSNRDGRGNPKPGDDRIIRLRPSNTTGLNKVDIIKKSLLIYPNPVSADQILRVDATYSGVKYQIINIQGEMVMNGNISGSADISIDKALGKGMYLLRIFTSTFAESARFLIL